MNVSYRLLSFATSDNEKPPDECDEGSSSCSEESYGSDCEKPEFHKKKDNKEFLVQMFGINEKGETASIFVTGYTPFFYVKVPPYWKSNEKHDFIGKLKNDMGEWYQDSIFSSKYVNKKKLYGFDGGITHKFLLIQFNNELAMKKAKNLWYTYVKNNRRLGKYHHTEIYEANIPPMMRMFHIRKMSPSGWVELPAAKTIVHKFHTTSCKYEYTINYRALKPQPNKETRVPYKICSFDIEASSSHGDFPTAIKNYKKVAYDMLDYIQLNGDELTEHGIYLSLIHI